MAFPVPAADAAEACGEAVVHGSRARGGGDRGETVRVAPRTAVWQTPIEAACPISEEEDPAESANQRSEKWQGTNIDIHRHKSREQLHGTCSAILF
jgi:hypothetical protein